MKNVALIALVFTGASLSAVAADLPTGSVPEIRYDSVADFLKLPPDLHLGEASGVAVNSKKHVFVFSRGNTTGPAYGATASQVLEFGPTVNSFARSERICTPGRSRTPSASTRTTISGPWTRART